MWDAALKVAVIRLKGQAMLEHTSEQNMTPSVRPTIIDPPRQTLSAERQAQIEACLEHLCARAAADNPQQARHDLRAEMQARLETLIAAHQELDSDLDAAAVAALEQLRREYHTTAAVRKVKTRSSLWQRYPHLRPTLLPFSMFSLFYIGDMTRMTWRIWAHLFGIPIDDNGNFVGNANPRPENYNVCDAVFYRFELIVVPLLVGLITGILLRQRGGRATLTALALLAAVSILLPGFLYGLAIMGNGSSPLVLSFQPGAVGATYWVALGYLGARIGDRLSRRGVRLIRARRRARCKAPAVRRSTLDTSEQPASEVSALDVPQKRFRRIAVHMGFDS
jgi:hypothetical protein